MVLFAFCIRGFYADRFMTAKPITTYTCKLTSGQADKLRGVLEAQGYVFREVPYSQFAGAKDKLNVVYYTSGKLVVQGKGTDDFVRFVLEPEILGEARLGYENVLDPSRLDPRIGIDESGKGDYFGPLCVAGVYVNGDMIDHLEQAGLMDSKRIGSDKRIQVLADVIRKTPGCHYTVVPIGPEAYNRLQSTMRSVNAILAWGHARVIENLMKRKDMMKPAPVRAISDQFARSKSTVADALMAGGREIELVQRHKAESDLAVAAASILARDAFVHRMHQLSEKYGIEIPKGASQRVIEVGAELVRRHGEAVLNEVAKRHFKTTQKVLGSVT
jgi:ribonuclease HIII